MTKPIILTISENNIDIKLIREAARVVREGGIIAFPTETVYGIGCLRPYQDSIKRIYEIKGRDFNKPLAVYLPDTKRLRKIVDDISPAADTLIRKFLPGPLTIILKNEIGEPTGFRISPQKVLRKLLGEFLDPMVGTSANKSGERDPVNAEEVIASLGDDLDLVIDSGPCTERLPSTVVDCTGTTPKILREGKVTANELLLAFNYHKSR